MNVSECKILNLLHEAEKNSGKMLHLTANENILSDICRKAENSILSMRYLIGNHNNLQQLSNAKTNGFALNGVDSIQSLLIAITHLIILDCMFL